MFVLNWLTGFRGEHFLMIDNKIFVAVVVVVVHNILRQK